MTEDGQITILYAEDEPDAREMVTAMLTRKCTDAFIMTAGNGEEGLALFRNRPADIVITDISMPMMDGIRMAKEIRRLKPETFIIAVTAYSDTNYLLDSIDMRINAYVLKPIDYGKLWLAIDKCIEVIALKRQVREQNDHIRKLSRAVEESPSSIVIADSEGIIEYTNSKFTEMTGYEPSEIKGTSLRTLKTGITSDEWEELWQAVVSGKQWRGEHLLRAKKDELFWASVSISPIFDADGCITHCVVVNEDITERKKAEAALRESEERYRHLYHSAPVMLHSIDRNGRLVDVSDQWLQHLGYQLDEVIGHKFTEFLAGSSRQFTEEVAIPEFFKDGHAMNVPYQLVKKNGEVIDFLLSACVERNPKGEVTRSLAVMVDVTERKRAEEALQESETRYRSLVEHSIDGVLLTTTEGAIMEANREACRLFGRTEEEMRQTERAVIIQPAEQAYAAVLEDRLRAGAFRGEVVGIRPDGSTFPAEISSTVFRNRTGQRRTSMIIRDVSDRRRAEAEIATLNADLAARASELEMANHELHEFCETVSHDLRTPLAAISGFSDLLLEFCAAKLDERERQYLQSIYKTSHEMGALLSGLLDLTRVTHEEMVRSEVDLCSLAKEIVADLMLTDPLRQVMLQTGDSAVVSGDPRLLRVALQNLLNNAWKYTGRKEGAVIEFGTCERGGCPVHFVRDNGAGFDATDSDRLFIPFHKQYPADPLAGTGVGLATVQRIIHRHNGRVWAEGEPGKGATFYFTVGRQ